MTRFNMLSIVAAAALMVSGGAFAASGQPASGQQPDGIPAASQASTQSRQAVEAAAAKQAPADGVQNAQGAAPSGKALTRNQVRAQTKAAEQGARGFPDQSGNAK